MAETNPKAAPAGAEVVGSEESALSPLLKQQVSDTRAKLREATKANPDTQTKIEDAIRVFIETFLKPSDIVSDDALERLSGLIAGLEKKLTEQIDLILHHPQFQKVEGTWRGLEHLVYGTETDIDLKIRVLNVRKTELRETFDKFKGASWDQSPLFKKIYGDEYDMHGGHPYGCLIGDYQFNHSAPDVGILAGMAQIASAAQAPFISGTDPSLLDLDSWEQLREPRDLAKIFERPEWTTWRGFRDSDDAKYVGLTLPRFLSRLPYGKDNPVKGLAGYQEKVEGGDHAKYTWSNSAYAMATNITQAFKYYGWCSCIRGKHSGGEVSGLNCHTFPTDDGGVDMKCPTEIGIGQRREHELANLGLMALCHWKNTDAAAFLSANSLYKPKEFDDPDATANSKLNASLAYLFAACRFSHFLKKMAVEAIGSYKSRADMEKWLDKWIKNYVTTDASPSDETKRELPLAAAEVEVKEVLGNPGYYEATFYLRPHYQLEGLKASLRLVTKVPSVKKTDGGA